MHVLENSMREYGGAVGVADVPLRRVEESVIDVRCRDVNGFDTNVVFE